jgi:hypothetical protein
LSAPFAAPAALVVGGFGPTQQNRSQDRIALGERSGQGISSEILVEGHFEEARPEQFNIDQAQAHHGQT